MRRNSYRLVRLSPAGGLAVAREMMFVIQPLCQTLAVTSGKPAVVLFHPGSSSGRIWQDVVPLLSEHLGVQAPTLLGAVSQ